jgi:hypothetical protein
MYIPVSMQAGQCWHAVSRRESEARGRRPIQERFLCKWDFGLDIPLQKAKLSQVSDRKEFVISLKGQMMMMEK